MNHEIINVNLFFTNIEGVTKGFALVFSLLIGAIVSLMLQLPILLRRGNKIKKKVVMKVQPKQILVALDYDSFNQAERICKLLNPDKFRIKVGKQLFSAEGPKILEKSINLGLKFLDLKIHDIPNTVYKSLLNILI